MLRGALTLVAALVAVMLARWWWARRRRPSPFEFGGLKYKSRPLRRAEFCICPFPPAERWRGQARSYRDHFGQPLWVG